MPTVILEVAQGRSLEQKRALAKDITDALVKDFKVPPEIVRIVFHEYPLECVAQGGTLACDSVKK
jgi:4-oxalocrotonate tautomerase